MKRPLSIMKYRRDHVMANRFLPTVCRAWKQDAWSASCPHGPLVVVWLEPKPDEIVVAKSKCESCKVIVRWAVILRKVFWRPIDHQRHYRSCAVCGSMLGGMSVAYTDAQCAHHDRIIRTVREVWVRYLTICHIRWLPEISLMIRRLLMLTSGCTVYLDNVRGRRTR